MGMLRRIFGTDEVEVEVAGLSGEATIVSLREGGPYPEDLSNVVVDEPAMLGRPDTPGEQGL